MIGHKRDGRACYDTEAKRELIEACLRSWMSVARVVLVAPASKNLIRWTRSAPGRRNDRLAPVCKGASQQF